MPEERAKEKVFHSLSSGRYLWRTASGISKEANLDVRDVISYLDRSPKVIKSSKTNEKGQTLYALREEVEKKTPILKKIWHRAANTSY